MQRQSNYLYLHALREIPGRQFGIDIESADITNVVPAQYHADLVLLLPDGKAVVDFIIEVQLRNEGRVEAVLAVLEARGFVVNEQQREQMSSSQDLDRLGTWVRRAATLTDAVSLRLPSHTVVGPPTVPYASTMPTPVERLTEEVLALPTEARALLADRLVESLDPLTDEAIRKDWALEAIRRRDEARSGGVGTISEDAVADRVRRLLRK